jgi:hypothetical protein
MKYSSWFVRFKLNIQLVCCLNWRAARVKFQNCSFSPGTFWVWDPCGRSSFENWGRISETPHCSKTAVGCGNNQFLCDIWGSDNSLAEYYGFLGCYTMSIGKVTGVSKDHSVSIFRITDSLTCMKLKMNALRTIERYLTVYRLTWPINSADLNLHHFVCLEVVI